MQEMGLRTKQNILCYIQNNSSWPLTTVPALVTGEFRHYSYGDEMYFQYIEVLCEGQMNRSFRMIAIGDAENFDVDYLLYPGWGDWKLAGERHARAIHLDAFTITEVA